MKLQQETLGTKFYLSLLHFLLNAKQHMITLGAEHGLSSIQAITLLILDDQRACPMKHLGQLFHCDASNVTGIIDGLENKGLVVRENDPKDRRVKTIRVCPAGKKLQEHILQRLTQDNEHLFESLTHTELLQFAGIMDKLSTNSRH